MSRISAFLHFPYRFRSQNWQRKIIPFVSTAWKNIRNLIDASLSSSDAKSTNWMGFAQFTEIGGGRQQCKEIGHSIISVYWSISSLSCARTIYRPYSEMIYRLCFTFVEFFMFFSADGILWSYIRFILRVLYSEYCNILINTSCPVTVQFSDCRRNDKTIRHWYYK